MEILYGITAALAAGLLGAMGLGGGSVLLLYLACTGTDQRTAQGINLFFILPAGLAGLWQHRKNGLLDPKPLPPILAGGAAGLAVGTAGAGLLPEALLSRLFGYLVLLTALRELYAAAKTLHKKKGEKSA